MSIDSKSLSLFFHQIQKLIFILSYSDPVPRTSDHCIKQDFPTWIWWEFHQYSGNEDVR